MGGQLACHVWGKRDCLWRPVCVTRRWKLERIKGGKTEDVKPRMEMQENTTGCSRGSKYQVCRGCVALSPHLLSPLAEAHGVGQSLSWGLGVWWMSCAYRGVKGHSWDCQSQLSKCMNGVEWVTGCVCGVCTQHQHFPVLSLCCCQN